MTKPKNMTPEQEAEWRARRKASVDRYNSSEKRNVALNRYRAKPEKRSRDNAKILARMKTDDGKASRRERRAAIKQFEQSISRLLDGEDIYGIGGQP